MPALALSDMENLYLWICKVHRDPQAAPNWITMEHTLRMLLDDHAELILALDEIVDHMGEDTVEDIQAHAAAVKAESQARIA